LKGLGSRSCNFLFYHRRPKKPFSDEELEKLRRACMQERDIALIEFLYSTGIRASELISLNQNDIDFTGVVTLFPI